MFKEEASGKRGLNGRRFAGVPRRHANKCIDEAERNDQESGAYPAEARRLRHQINQDCSDWSPGEQVETEPASGAFGHAGRGGAREERMHKSGSVLDFNASEDDHSGNNERFCFSGVVGLAGLVFIAAEHWKTTRVYVPSFRHADFNPAEDTIYFEDRFIVHFGGRKVQFDAAKNGGGAAALEARARYAPLTAAEYGDRVEHRCGTGCACDMILKVLHSFCFGAQKAARFERSPHQEQPDGYERN